MLNITILGENKTISTEETIELLNFCCEQTIPLDSDKSEIKHIKLDFRPDPESDDETMGWMSHDEKKINGQNQVWATLWIRSGLSREETLKTICHEFVHVKHEVVEERKEDQGSENGYWSDPFELDAFKQEDILYDKYMKAYGYKYSFPEETAANDEPKPVNFFELLISLIQSVLQKLLNGK